MHWVSSLPILKILKRSFQSILIIEDKAKLDNEWLDIFRKIEVKEAEKNKTSCIPIMLTCTIIVFIVFLQNMTALFYTENNAAQKEYIDNYPLFIERTPFSLLKLSIF